MKLEIDTDEEEKDDINIDDERECHWRNVFSSTPPSLSSKTFLQ